ncbi:MAG: thioredoxin domain-containing protein [Anaerolinea sp.]|nr:thioredoxin domain-containing protein [Anaerolinea sp.]
MTQGNNPKNKSSKPGDPKPANRPTGQQPKSDSTRRSGSADRPFTQKSRVRSGGSNPGRPASSGESARQAGGGSRAAERKQEREQEQRRRQLTIGAGIIIGVILLAVVTLLIVRTPADAPIPENTLTLYDGIQKSRTQEGFAQLGDPNSAVRVGLYSSFDCTHCRDFHDELQPALVQRVRDGQIALFFVPLFGTGSVTNGQGAARAAVCAGNQGRFWEMHDALFYWQGLYVNQAFTNNRIQTGASSLGLDVGAFNGCILSDDTSEILTAANTSRNALGASFVGTPTVTINGVVPTDSEQNVISDRQAILAAIDEAIARLASGGTTPEVTPEVTTEATVEPEAAATEPAPAEQPEVTPESTTAS